MRLRLLFTLLALLVASLATASGAAAKSRYKVGMGDQHPQLFQDKHFKSLKIKKVRVIVPWNWRERRSDPLAIQAYLDTAKTQRKSVLVAFGALRGCYNNGRYSRSKRCRAPSQSKYKRSLKAFRRKYPQVKTFQPWNELNSKSQPTYRSPKLAARYYKTLKGVCKRCTIVAADILDSSNAVRYVKKFQRYTRKQRPRLWGLHNYSDVNRSRARVTPAFLRAVPGKVWLTETGGLVKFLPHFRYSTRRAAKQVKYMFKLADRFSRKRGGLRSRIDRLYPYTYFGEKNSRKTRFDAGLVGPLKFTKQFALKPGSGKPRTAYKVFKKIARKKSK